MFVSHSQCKAKLKQSCESLTSGKWSTWLFGWFYSAVLCSAANMFRIVAADFLRRPLISKRNQNHSLGVSSPFTALYRPVIGLDGVQSDELHNPSFKFQPSLIDFHVMRKWREANVWSSGRNTDVSGHKIIAGTTFAFLLLIRNNVSFFCHTV